MACGRGFDSPRIHHPAQGRPIQGGPFFVPPPQAARALKSFGHRSEILLSATFAQADTAGRSFVKEHIASVQASGHASVDLRWANPETQRLADAVMVSKRVRARCQGRRRAAHAASSKPTLTLPSGHSTTGLLMTLG